ncbi:hypothetical protein Tco_0349356 [Tanacetum coccineum]
MSEGFIDTAYLKLRVISVTVDEQMIPEEPVSSTRTLSSLQHLTKDFSYGGQFIDDKSSEANNEKMTADTEAESMMSVTIQQDTSVIPPMTSPVICPVPRPDSPTVHWPLPTTTTTTSATTTTTTTLPLPPQSQQGPSDPIIIKRMGKLEKLITNLVEENQALETRLDKQGSRINKLETMDLPKMIREQTVELFSSSCPLQGSPYGVINHRDECDDFDVDKAQEETRKKVNKATSGASGITGAYRFLLKAPPPPLLLSTHQGDQSTSTAAPSSSKTVASAEYSAWTTTDTQIKPSITTIPDDLYMDDEPLQLTSISSGERWTCYYSYSQHEPSWWKPLTEDRPASLEPAWTIPSTDLHFISNSDGRMHTSFSVLEWMMHILRTCLQALPLGGEPGHITIQSDFFFNKDLEYLRYGRKIGRPALSISKMKAAFYPDVGLEQLVPDQFWIEEECKYDIAAMYGISHWWFQRQRFYIDRFSSEGDRRAVPNHMRILSVVRIEVFSMYGYDYMKKIILRRADLKEYVIAERDFKYMYPSDFEDLYLLNLQGHLNHLSPDDKKVLTTAINLWTRNLVIRQRVEDFQLGIESYQTQFYEIHKVRGWYYSTDRMKRWDTESKSSESTGTNPGNEYRFGRRKNVVRTQGVHVCYPETAKIDVSFQNLRVLFWSYKDGKVRYSLPRSRQNRRDLPRDNPLVSVEVLRNWVNTYAVRITWLIADIEDKYQDSDTLAQTLPSYSDPSEDSIVSFLTEINIILSSFSL